MAKVVIIAVGGPSCSGKSTLSNWLARVLPNARILHQDKFYKPDSEIPVDDSNNIANWDCPDALDNEKFIETLRDIKKVGLDASILDPNRPTVNEDDVDDTILSSLKSKFTKSSIDNNTTTTTYKNESCSSFIIVDGFLMYNDTRIIDQFDLCIFLSASKDTLVQRRSLRNGYITKDGFWAEPEGYFEDYVWPGYLEYNKLVFDEISKQKTSCTSSSNSNNFTFQVIDSETNNVQQLLSTTIDLIVSKNL